MHQFVAEHDFRVDLRPSRCGRIVGKHITEFGIPGYRLVLGIIVAIVFIEESDGQTLVCKVLQELDRLGLSSFEVGERLPDCRSISSSHPDTFDICLFNRLDHYAVCGSTCGTICSTLGEIATGYLCSHTAYKRACTGGDGQFPQVNTGIRVNPGRNRRYRTCSSNAC